VSTRRFFLPVIFNAGTLDSTTVVICVCSCMRTVWFEFMLGQYSMFNLPRVLLILVQVARRSRIRSNWLHPRTAFESCRTSRRLSIYMYMYVCFTQDGSTISGTPPPRRRRKLPLFYFKPAHGESVKHIHEYKICLCRCCFCRRLLYATQKHI
jgi:hypothetical protein